MVKHLHLKGLVALAAAFATSMGAYAATPISDAAGLAAIGKDLAGEYELTADITLTGEWIAIGTEKDPFTGTFDGKGHTIKGLSVTDNTENNGHGNNFVGLFGVINGGTVKNFAIVEAIVYGNEHVGIVAGRVCGGGVIDNVFTAGIVSGRDHEGGIAGDAGDDKATVSNCISSANVDGRNYQAGGIVGWTKGNILIENNIFTGEVYCGAWGACGGIVGFVEDGTTTVKNNVCAARKLVGNYQNGRDARAIVANILNNNSKIVSSDNLVSDATIIINKDNGEVVTPGEETEMRDIDGTQVPVVVGVNGTVTPAADLKKAATYTTLGFNASALKFVDDNYPVLSFVNPPISDVIMTAHVPEELFAGNTFNIAPISSYGYTVAITLSDNNIATLEGSTLTFVKGGTLIVTLTTEGNTYAPGTTAKLTIEVQDFDPTIRTADDIKKFSEVPNANFVLAADIDMTGVEFKPIANFTGTLDGQGHWIRNASYSNADQNCTAFFAQFGGAFIKNVGFEGFNFVGNADVAAVVGEFTSSGVISNVVVNNCYLEGRDHVASIAGKLKDDGTIVNCIANAEIKTRSYQAAGIVGVGIKGTVDKCIFSGTVAANGTTNLAGIVSLLDDNGITIKNCLAAAVSYTGNQNFNANIVNIYQREIVLENNWVAEYSIKNGTQVAGGATDGENGGLATTTNVRSKDWYTETLGFDFDNDWKFLAGGEGNMLPVLKWMNAPLTTVIFNLPSVDGANVTYFEGTEFYSPRAIMGSWGQGVTITQLSGEDYATIFDGEIYVGDEDGMLPKGGGTATFKVGFAEGIANLFAIDGRDTFDVNVSISGEEKEISTVDEFLKISKNPSGKYTLGADIDLAGVEFAGFCNDGSSAFTGTIDGQGHSIKNLTLKFTSGSDKGLFGKTSGATFKNIAFTQFLIDGGLSGANHVGLIGGGSVYLENVAIVGHVIGNDHVGLVAGDSDGIEMLNCYAVGTVEGRSQVGGYFGCTLEGGCKLENCLSNINASAIYRGWVGGFVGLVDKANSAITIQNCVSIGDCSSTGDGTPHVTAPFIAGNNAGDTPNAVVTFTGNIYNTAAFMDGATEWPAKNETAEGGVVEAAQAQNPNTLQLQGTYTAIGWDFDGVWKMGEGEYKYPVLGTVTVTDFTAPSGIENVIADAEANVVVAAANGEIIVSGLGETSVITVYTAAGLQVASVTVNDAAAAVAVPANGFYIVAVATDGTVTTAKVVVK